MSFHNELQVNRFFGSFTLQLFTQCQSIGYVAKVLQETYKGRILLWHGMNCCLVVCYGTRGEQDAFCIFSFGYFPGVKLQLADVSEPCISSIFKGWVYTVHPAFEDGTDTGFRNVGQLQFDAGEVPKRKYTIFKSRRKSEIKKMLFFQRCLSLTEIRV